MAENVRAVAAQAVARVLTGQSLSASLEAALAAVEDSDRALLQQLCYGTLRASPKLDGLLDQILDKPLRRKDADVYALLLIGLYQLEALRIPDHAAVAATVDAIEPLKKPWARGLTNAVLRRYLREREALLSALDTAAAASHPAWLFGKLRKQWPEQFAAIIEANNEQPPMTLRINASRTSRDACLTALNDAGIAATAGVISPQALTLQQPMDVDALPGFTAGELSVQDEAAQVAAHLLGAKAGERILDACAAPGGKACHILELQPNLKELVARDIDAARLEKVVQNLARLELQATLEQGDAGNASEHHAPQSFDRILVDAPCSATGVIRRHPDVKTLRRPEDIPSFAEQQLAILSGLWPLLKPGGVLLYATCSVLREENAQVIARFLEEAADARIDPIDEAYGVNLGGALQLLPSANGSDGLFYCRLQRL